MVENDRFTLFADADFRYAASATDEDYDFTTEEDSYFIEGWAHESTESLPWQLQFTSVVDSGSGVDGDAFGVTPSVHVSLPESVPIMCGLIGVHVDTTLVDDNENPLSMEATLEVTIDVERWSPLL